MKSSGKRLRAEKSASFVRRSDWLIIAVLMVAGLVWLLAALPSRDGGRRSAEIYLDGALIAEVALDEDRVFSLPECPQITFEVKDGTIRFLSSDCPDKTCVRSGFLHGAGGYAVCLPNRVHIKLVDPSKRGTEPDAVTGHALPAPDCKKGGARV